MIKKPLDPTLPDYLLSSRVEIDQRWQKVADYKNLVFDGVAKDFGTDNAYELVIRLAEKYHEPYKQNQRQGRKPKWTPQIDCMLAALVETRLDDASPRSSAEEIEWLLTLKLFKDFVQSGNKQEIEGFETIRKHYEAGKKSEFLEYEMELYRADPSAWVAKFAEILTKNLIG